MINDVASSWGHTKGLFLAYLNKKNDRKLLIAFLEDLRKSMNDYKKNLDIKSQKALVSSIEQLAGTRFKKGLITKIVDSINQDKSVKKEFLTLDTSILSITSVLQHS